MIAALVGETGWTIKYIEESLTQYQIDRLLEAFLEAKTRQIPSGELAEQLKELSSLQFGKPETQTRDLPGGRMETKTTGMTSVQQILNAAKGLKIPTKQKADDTEQKTNG